MFLASRKGGFFMAKLAKFYFVKATYLLGDEQGKEVVMTIDYKDNSFRLRGSGLRRTAMIVARDLLARKHGVNFADKIRVYSE